MTRTQRYKAVNDILYWRNREGVAVRGSDRMHADELDRFEWFCPDFDSRDDAARERAIREWRNHEAAIDYEGGV